MKLVIVDDRPFFMWDAVKELKDAGIDDITMLYFHGPLTYRPEKNKEIEEECERLGIKLVHAASRLELQIRLDEHCADKDTILFVDYSLGDTDIFDDRINIICAREKAQNPEDFCLWFYIGGDDRTVKRLNKVFDGHTIPVAEFKPQIHVLKFDMDFIRNKFLDGEG